eukprot:GFUD01132618.1.p1 GENE.GFUD01132618.1~~GFUD01132618.1.p1  ORF type:complete len:141 (-),score=27.45 GFUD01132618.1:24-446(-)
MKFILFSCYPKVDGGIYVFDPRREMSDETVKRLTQELKSKIVRMEKMFTKKNSTSFPNIEGTSLAEFTRTSLQADWDTACREHGLYSRCPSQSEVDFYDLECDASVFLPPDDDETESRLPELVKKFVKEASAFVMSKISL